MTHSHNSSLQRIGRCLLDSLVYLTEAKENCGRSAVADALDEIIADRKSTMASFKSRVQISSVPISDTAWNTNLHQIWTVFRSTQPAKQVARILSSIHDAEDSLVRAIEQLESAAVLAPLDEELRDCLASAKSTRSQLERLLSQYLADEPPTNNH